MPASQEDHAAAPIVLSSTEGSSIRSSAAPASYLSASTTYSTTTSEISGTRLSEATPSPIHHLRQLRDSGVITRRASGDIGVRSEDHSRHRAQDAYYGIPAHRSSHGAESESLASLDNGGDSRVDSRPLSQPGGATGSETALWSDLPWQVSGDEFRARLIEAQISFARWILDSDLHTRSDLSEGRAEAESQREPSSAADHDRTQRTRVHGTSFSPGRRHLASLREERRPSRRMEQGDRNDVPLPSGHDYLGWAPGTNASSEHSRPSLNSLRAMASRNHSSRSVSHMPVSSARSAGGASSLERRYFSERQRQLEMMQQSMLTPEQRGLRSSYLPGASPPYHPYGSGSSNGSGGGGSAGGGGGGFASTVVDSDGNPIDTGTTAELPNPRSIVYNLPPSRSTLLPVITTSATDASSIHRRLDASVPYDSPGSLEGYPPGGSSSNATVWDNDAWARYTHLQRQERHDRNERAQRAFLRTERLRRSGAGPSEYHNSSSTSLHRNRSGGRAYPLDELRRDLHNLHRDQHPAASPPSSSADAARDGVKRAIQYLHRIRPIAGECSTHAERLRAACEEGFGIGDSGVEKIERDDFVTETSKIGTLPETSWLIPGTVFKGSQRAVNVSAIANVIVQGASPYATAQGERTSRALLDSYIRQLGSRSGTGTGTGTGAGAGAGAVAGNSASRADPVSNRAAWIESVLQRDRHTTAGAGADADARWSSYLSRIRSESEGLEATGNEAGRLNIPAPPPLIGPPPLSGSSYQPYHHHPHHHHLKAGEGEDTWPVKVTVTSVDYESMTLTGTMEAMNVPNKNSPGPSSQRQSPSIGSGGGEGGAGADSSSGNSNNNSTTITTFLEGEILDLQRFSLETRGYNADSSVDSTYWRRLEPFRSLDDGEIVGKMLSTTWLKKAIGSECLLMRWKEKCFVDPSDANQGLTISGFYYISLHRQTGKIEGLYFDPQSSPYQHLCLTPEVRQLPVYKFQ